MQEYNNWFHEIWKTEWCNRIENDAIFKPPSKISWGEYISWKDRVDSNETLDVVPESVPLPLPRRAISFVS